MRPQQNTLLTLFLALSLALAAGCSDDSGGTQDLGPQPDGVQQSDGPAIDSVVKRDVLRLDTGGGACGGCTAAQGCLRVSINRVADDKDMPWKIWPGQADGKGTLVVSASDGTTVAARSVVAGVDFTASAVKVEVELGCVIAGKTLAVRAFLDDNENAQANATSSADYIDTCPAAPRKVDVVPAAGKNTRTSITLANSCD